MGMKVGTRLSLKSALIRKGTASPVLGRFILVGDIHFQGLLGGKRVQQAGSVKELRGLREVCAK